jgi:hypothetical protein
MLIAKKRVIKSDKPELELWLCPFVILSTFQNYYFSLSSFKMIFLLPQNYLYKKWDNACRVIGTQYSLIRAQCWLSRH